MIAKWKREALEGMDDTFSKKGNKDPGHREEIKTLQAKIRELIVERDFSQSLRSISVHRRREMIDAQHRQLSLTK